MVNNVSSVVPNTNPQSIGFSNPANDKAKNTEFVDTIKAVEKYVTRVDDLQQSSDMAIKDLLAGKTEDINSVVTSMAKADMSFKLLVGIRNKLIEAYQQTMRMPI